jgi:hydroxymethylglutaryl-CoA lyase
MVILTLINKALFMEVKIIECPRDAMQGLSKIISTDTKVNYLNALLEVGFDTLDCGSFVNAKIIPQMADTSEVIKRLKMTETKLSVIVANHRGAESAVEFDEITYLGFPFSVSESFQMRNTNSSMETSLNSVESMTRFDGALKGFGGCPMADDKLVGNMPTENMVLYFEEKGIDLGIDREKFREAMLMAGQVFG